MFIIDDDNKTLHVHKADSGKYLGCLMIKEMVFLRDARIYGVGYGTGNFLHLLVQRPIDRKEGWQNYMLGRADEISGYKTYKIK